MIEPTDVIAPVFEILKSVVVALAVELAMVKRDMLVSPLFACTESLAHGVVVPTPNLPAMEATVVVPATVKVPLIVVTSVIASPKVVLPSTVKVDAEVVESVTEPTEVRLFAKTSPSASTRNFTEPPTEAEMRLLSPAALAGLTTRDASNGNAFAAPILQEENVCGTAGARVARRPPAKVDVAELEVATKFAASTVELNLPTPVTSRGYAGDAVRMPSLPAASNEDVAVDPKYAGPYAEKSDVDALPVEMRFVM